MAKHNIFKLIGAFVLLFATQVSAQQGGQIGNAGNTILAWVQIAGYIFAALIFMAGLWAGFKGVTGIIAWGKDQQSGTTTQQGAAGGDKGKASAVYLFAAVVGIFFGGLVYVFSSDLNINDNNALQGVQIQGQSTNN